MTVSVIIPTMNAEKNIALLLDTLLAQTVRAEIIVVDSSSDDHTRSLVEKYGDAVRLICISREEFDHGRTRDAALRASTGDFVFFLTQDALPTDAAYLEKLLAAFEEETVAAAFARQIAYPDAPEYEKLTREFNYPEKSRTWGTDNIAELGVKAFFFSDAGSAYRRSAYLCAGGFDHPVKTNEDMLMAAKLLHSGYRIAYNAEASLFHSHRFTLSQDFRRSMLSSQVMNEYKGRLAGVSCHAEGGRLLRYVLTGLIKKGRLLQSAAFILRAGVRFIGNECGKCERCRH